MSRPLDASFPPPGQFLESGQFQIPLLKPHRVTGLMDAILFSLVMHWELCALAGWNAPAKNHPLLLVLHHLSLPGGSRSPQG